MNQIRRAIFRTLAYADIFDYPLKEQEIYKFLVSKFQIPNSKIQKELSLLSKLISIKNGFYFLTGREKIIKIRKKREKWSQDKLKIANRVAKWLHLIPTIKMVAVTGALSLGNSDEHDDIDFLVITAKNRLWISRLLVVFLIELLGRRRRPKDKEIKDKICLNMFLDEGHLKIPQKEQDLFTAHEICQLKPLWYKDDCYQNFINANLWSKKFLANWRP